MLPILVGSCKKENSPTGYVEEFEFESQIIDDLYPIFVYIPPSYTNQANANHLIIGLDGETRFDELVAILSDESQNKNLPPYIFIGIGNYKNRIRDYTPSNSGQNTGGAKKFYQFIANELIPELETKYNIDPSNTKTLIGHSFGGLFTHFAMFQERTSNPFDKFISIGCSYWFDTGVIFEEEQKYADMHSDLPIKFFNGMGGLEGGISLGSFEQMNKRLMNRNYPNFEQEAKIIKNHGHSGAYLIAIQKGLDYVYNH